MGLVPCIAVSTGYILLVLFLAELARRLVAPLNPGLVKTAFNVSFLFLFYCTSPSIIFEPLKLVISINIIEYLCSRPLYLSDGTLC
jgi:hypothetical protein